MTRQEAIDNIGQPFKVSAFTDTGIVGRFDKILQVDLNGTIHGEFIEAHCSDCRLKEMQPEKLKKLFINKI